MKKILSILLSIFLFVGIGNVHAAKVLAPIHNSTAIPIGASDSSGNAVILQGDATNGLEVDVTRITGPVTTVSSSGTINYVGAVAVSSDVSSLGKNANATWGNSSMGVSSLHVKSDGTTTICSTTNQYCPPTVNAAGSQFVTLSSTLAGEDQSESGGIVGTQGVTNKFVSTSGYVLSVDQSSTLEASSVVKASDGVLYAVSGRIDSTAPSATYFLQFLNSASLPSDGAVTMLRGARKYVHATGTDTQIDIDMSRYNGVYGSAGLVLCLSSTEFTKTISGAYLSMTAYYK